MRHLISPYNLKEFSMLTQQTIPHFYLMAIKEKSSKKLKIQPCSSMLFLGSLTFFKLFYDSTLLLLLFLLPQSCISHASFLLLLLHTQRDQQVSRLAAAAAADAT
jgi:hypothetical protein